MLRRLPLLLLLTACARPAGPIQRPTAAGDPPPAPVERAGRGLPHDLEDTLAFLATRPTEETPLDPGLATVEGVGSADPAVCGACHQAIYAEWQTSTHRHAWNDPQFQAEIQKSGNRWLCANCHTPTLAQQPMWPVGLVDGDVEAPILIPNPAFQAELQGQGITCAGCHVREGRIHGPGLPDSTAPHPVQADPTYRSGELCLRCHQAERTYPGKGFVCTFTTGKEWQARPASMADDTCVTCHMPAIERPVAVGGPTRTVQRHWFKGAGIPKFADSAPPDDAPPAPGLTLLATPADGSLTLELGNRGGHALPTGDPERWVQIDVTFLDADDTAMAPPWSARVGQTWSWYPVPEKRGDNRLMAGEHRTLRVPIPAGAHAAQVQATSHRISSENAAHHHLDDYPTSRVTHSLRVAVTPPG